MKILNNYGNKVALTVVILLGLFSFGYWRGYVNGEKAGVASVTEEAKKEVMIKAARKFIEMLRENASDEPGTFEYRSGNLLKEPLVIPPGESVTIKGVIKAEPIRKPDNKGVITGEVPDEE